MAWTLEDIQDELGRRNRRIRRRPMVAKPEGGEG